MGSGKCYSARLNHSFQVFQFASCVLAITLSDVKNVHVIPFEESSEGTGRKARPHMSGQNRAAHVGFNAPGDAFLNREAKATVAVMCRPFQVATTPGMRLVTVPEARAVIPATRSSNAISVPAATRLSGEQISREMCSRFALSHQLSTSDNRDQTLSAVADRNCLRELEQNCPRTR